MWFTVYEAVKQCTPVCWHEPALYISLPFGVGGMLKKKLILEWLILVFIYLLSKSFQVNLQMVLQRMKFKWLRISLWQNKNSCTIKSIFPTPAKTIERHFRQFRLLLYISFIVDGNPNTKTAISMDNVCVSNSLLLLLLLWDTPTTY